MASIEHKVEYDLDVEGWDRSVAFRPTSFFRHRWLNLGRRRIALLFALIMTYGHSRSKETRYAVAPRKHEDVRSHSFRTRRGEARGVRNPLRELVTVAFGRVR